MCRDPVSFDLSDACGRAIRFLCVVQVMSRAVSTCKMDPSDVGLPWSPWSPEVLPGLQWSPLVSSGL